MGKDVKREAAFYKKSEGGDFSMNKRICSLLLVCMLLFSSFVQAYAVETVGGGVESVEYEETHFQINFTSYDVEVLGDSMQFEVKETVATRAGDTAERNLERLEKVFADYPDVKADILNAYQNGEELLAVSFTEVPLMLVDDHYERVPVQKRGYESSEENGKGTFLMYTTISGGTTELGGEYKYTAITTGTWSNNILGGYKYPAPGADHVFQTSPNTFVRSSDDMSVQYDEDPIPGVEGDDFWCEDGDSSYIQYAIEDDPFGYRQCRRFTLMTVSAGPQSDKLREIHSYYIHTWEEMTLDVSVNISTDKEVSLSLTPGNEEKSWPAYNYVSFDF